MSGRNTHTVGTAPTEVIQSMARIEDAAGSRPAMISPFVTQGSCCGPFLPSAALPSAAAVSDAVSLEFPDRGGHVGFVSGRFPGHLDWLPKPEEVFTRERGGYRWTTVHLSGTVEEAKQDLSPRIVALFKESPGAYLGLLLRELEVWLKKTFGRE